jgi:pimeloyl-ACP methyl ester carboxylesterase
MPRLVPTLARLCVAAFASAALFGAVASVAQAQTAVGTTLPADFPVIVDASLNKPIIGFGAAGKVWRTPVVFVHGNNDTPFPTACNPYGRMQALAQHLADEGGYAASELWGLGYQGDQCDLLTDQTIRSSQAHTTTANVDDLRRFVHAVLDYTGARQVDIVGHSLGVIVAREWLRQDKHGHRHVRKLVAIDGPNRGIINCSPSPLNYWQAPSLGGFVPSSAVCQELGSPNTPFLQRLNSRHGKHAGTVKTLVIRNADTGFVYFPTQDGVLAGVPAIDVYGEPTDFSGSARIRGARELNLEGQGIHDPILFTTHLGILNSPRTWAATLEFLGRSQRAGHDHDHVD